MMNAHPAARELRGMALKCNPVTPFIVDGFALEVCEFTFQVQGREFGLLGKTKQHRIARAILFVAMLISPFTGSQSNAAKPHVERLLKKGESS
jgi:hypothetical protein